MDLVRNIQQGLARWRARQNIKLITTLAPEKIEAYGEKRLLQAFHRVAARVPAYRDLLRSKNVNPRAIKTVSDFKRYVPYLTKEEVFPCNNIERLCLDGQLGEIKGAMTSSGFSGVFSYGIITAENDRKASKGIDTALEHIFGALSKKTLIINSVPMGVKVPSSLCVANTSVRSDMALSIFQKLSKSFEQVIIVSDPHFLKKIVEDGIERGIDWKKENVHLISGEDWLPESLRTYLGELIGTDWNDLRRGLIGTTMGVAELDLNILHESKYTILIRRAAEKDPVLHKALFGEDADITPCVMHYYPHNTFIEESAEKDGGDSELVFSMLSETLLMPLMRYNTRDVGRILTYRQLEAILQKCGYPHLVPEAKLPVVLVGGRKGRQVCAGSRTVSPELARSCLYQDLEVAKSVTGNFLMQGKDDKIAINIQLKKGVEGTTDLLSRCKTAFSKINGAEITLTPYFDFRHGMTVDYETKFRHVV